MGAPTILISHTPDGGCTSACPTIAVPDCEDAALQAAESALAAAASATQASASAQTASSASESANAAVAGVLLAASNANTSAGQAASSASAASQSASAAAGSASTASASASTATARATQAAGSASSAASSATSAQASAAAAATSAQTSTTKAAAAAASATAALASEATAHENAVATAADRVAVAADKQVAELSKEAAQLSATEAAQSAFSAAQSAANAMTAGAVAGEAAGAAAGAAAAQPFASAASDSADEAAAQADIATTQAGVAAEQAGIATTQAGIATTQAGIATTKAGDAGTSASAALASQNSAAASALQAALIAAGLNYISAVAATSLPDPATRTSGDVYLVTTAGTAWTKTWAQNDLAIRNGAGGYDQVASTLWLGINAALVSSKAQRGGIVSAGTSAVGTTQDNTGLAFGTSDLTIGMWVRLPDWTAASTLLQKSNFVGLTLTTRNDGALYVGIGNGGSITAYLSTQPTNVSDGSWAFLAFVLDRDGNATFYVNGAQLGAPVSIAAQSAQTLTTTSPLYWFSNGTTHAAGTLGECWIINGLLSASRIADIYRAGSIAPFCTMTANATTGQNTATIDGLSFFQWLEMERADPNNNPIIPDRSGNGQVAILGASGLSVAVRQNWVNKVPRSALVGDGSANSKLTATLNSQNPGTGDMMLLWEGVYPQTLTGALAALTSVTTGAFYQPRSLLLTHSTSVGLRLSLFGATIDNVRRLVSISLQSQLLALGARGVLSTIIVRRSAGAVKVFLGIGRDPQRFADVTYLFSESSEGASPPAWGDEIVGTYLCGFQLDGTYSSAHTLARLDLANVAMTEAQLRAEYERGEPGPEWVGASNAVKNTSNCADVDYGAGFIGATATGFTAVAASGNKFAKAQPSFRVERGQKVSVVGTLALNNGKTVVPQVRLPSGTPVSLGAAGAFSVVVVATVANSTAELFFDTTGDADYTVSNLAVKVIGWTTRLRTDSGGGLTVLNGAKSATNDATDFLLSTTGITQSPTNPRRAVIRASTSTNGNQQLFGASVIDTTKKWRIRSWSITAAGVVTVSLGSASGGTQYASAVALAAGLNDITPTTRVPASANLWCASNGTAQLDHVVILDLVE
jgi:hypothetical protein